MNTDSSPTASSETSQLSGIKQAETWVFDLDNTLYPSSCRLFDQVEKNMTRFIELLLKCERDEAYSVQKTYFREHGTTMAGLMHH
ncbi:MAG: pyrimidine 5'-nucleotidase, partial [Rhodospirillales bacterium]|nr:pyrimidine 5'-nucleotidase [Rhodospirillales bacterium]